jgi:hypothetical protein
MPNCVNCENGSPSLSPMDNNLFAYNLDFEEAGQFDGNIGQQSWRSKMGAESSIKSYAYSYDNSDRLLSASYSGSSDFSVPFIDYDLNGNIQNLHRNGSTDSSVAAMDRLQYAYSGNKLLSVTDTITWNPDNGDFRDGNTSGNDYTYWSDGSLKSDANKGISLIEYDTYLKKVKQVTFSNTNWIKWFCDGQGGLLKRENSDGTEWGYSSNAIYKNDTLYQVGFSGGRVIVDTSGSFNYRFEYRDIWNNLRLEFTAEDSIVTIKQISDYDPLGFEFNQMIGVNVNHFKYQNQERISDFNLGVDFFKYRVSDPVIGRFWQVDPLAAQYSYNSVYAFQENKFGSGVELEGLEWSKFKSKGQTDIKLNSNITNSSSLNSKKFDKINSKLVKSFSKIFSQTKGTSASLELKQDNSSSYDITLVDQVQKPKIIKDSKGNIIGKSYVNGRTSKLGDTKNNSMIISVKDANGSLRSMSSIVSTINHETGHAGGLSHPWLETKTKDIKNQEDNLMNSGANPDITKRSTGGKDVTKGQIDIIKNNIK